MKNILEYIELNASNYADKIAFSDYENSITYSGLLDCSKRIGSAVSAVNTKNKPVAIYLDKGINLLCAMFGVVYSGNFYVVIDSEMPPERINKIFNTLNPVAIITDEAHLETSNQLSFSGKRFMFESAVSAEINEEGLSEIRSRQIDTDPLYALYTSGSTGVPKGAVVSHKSVIAYAGWFSNTFDITAETVFGNQTPFYFSMSVSDIYSTIVNGATLVIVPKMYFSFPIKLVEFLNERKVNTIYWVPSAISIVSNLKLFNFAKPEFLKKVLFAGEVMPTKQLNYWINNLGNDILYANLYGPTETTDICTYYVVNRKFSDDEPLPIGTHCDNCDVMIINDKGEEAAVGEEGELFVRGSFLANGYYNNPEKTSEVFVQNPLNSCYPETVYKTGDLVKENELGEIMYITRKDFQIKHMGYRIELGEIETAASSMEKMQETACLYDSENDKIVLFYCAKKTDDTDVMKYLKTKLPPYLIPNKYIKVKQMPHNQNGKIDRKHLKTLI
ncbi:MAG: amino acid adenylation domain-containing protein [Eubacterium sp.]|nr:amino acid adenylation domain-containing protein [Eubacterium sp.]MDE6505705.1 amino acid adenylation domain-containing protein [Eubacterium sp.]